MVAESERHIESVLAALRILECFEADVGLRAAELQAQTGFAYSRVMRLTGTLVARGFLSLDVASGRYFLGPGLFRLGKLLLPRFEDLAASVRPILSELVEATGQTAMFSVTDSVSRLVLCKQEPATALRYTVTEGQARPIGTGASGRVILAFGSSKLRAQALADLDADERTSVEARLSEVRTRGHDVSVSELTQGAFAVAAPVLGPDGQLNGVLTLAGPASALTEASQEEYLALLREQAARVQISAVTEPAAK